MLFNRVANIDTARDVLNELKKIPQNLINITNEFGLQICCFNEKFKPSWIGLCDESALVSYNRNANETACYRHKKRCIWIFDKDFEDIGEKAYSSIIHEFAHALDHALGHKMGKNNFLSMVDSNIFTGWEKKRGLDWYANINPLEYFAQAFMAYIYSDKETYKPWSYREHTQQELKEKDSDMFYYLKNLINR